MIQFWECAAMRVQVDVSRACARTFGFMNTRPAPARGQCENVNRGIYYAHYRACMHGVFTTAHDDDTRAEFNANRSTLHVSCAHVINARFFIF